MCRYDVRGEIYLAAVKRAEAGKEVYYTNVGNPHALGQAPVTFIRQVLSLVRSRAYIDRSYVCILAINFIVILLFPIFSACRHFC